MKGLERIVFLNCVSMAPDAKHLPEQASLITSLLESCVAENCLDSAKWWVRATQQMPFTVPPNCSLIDNDNMRFSQTRLPEPRSDFCPLYPFYIPAGALNICWMERGSRTHK